MEEEKENTDRLPGSPPSMVAAGFLKKEGCDQWGVTKN